MADNGQIDNLYFNVEVGGNAADEFDKMDKSLENIENNAKEAIEALESFANISKIDVLNKKLENVNKSLDEAVTKNKGLDDSGVLGDLTKRFSLNDKLAKEQSKVAQVTAETEAEWASVLEKVSTEEGRLALKIEQVTKATLEQRAQGKLTDEQFSSRAEKVTKLINKLEELRMVAKQDALKALEWQIPDMSLGDEQRANFEKILATAEGGSNAFDGIGESAKKAAVSIDYLMSTQGKLDGLQNELAQAYTKLLELTQGGAGYENQDVKKLVRQIERLEKDIDKLGDEGSNAFKKIDKSTKKANNSSRGYQKGLRGLLGTAKRFLVFGTFFTIQRQVSQAFKDGTANLYQYSKAIDGTFANSMDRLATSFLYLKNAIGAAVAPIINAFTPALERLIDTVAEFGNKLAETFAKLTGATTFKKAIKSHKEYAEAVNSTNNALAKFDEINNITTSKSKEEQDFGSMFEVANVSSNAKGFGELFAIEINSGLEKANNFLKTFDFGGATDTLLGGILKFIETLDWGLVGETFSNLLLGAFDIADRVSEFLSQPDLPNKIVTVFTDFIDGIAWEVVAESAITAAINAVIAGTEFIANLLGDVENQKKITDAIFKIIKGILKGVWESIKNRVKEKGIVGVLLDILTVLDPASALVFRTIKSFAASIWEVVSSVTKEDIANFGKKIGEQFSATGDFFKNLFSKIRDGLSSLWDKIKNWFKNGFDLGSLFKMEMPDWLDNLLFGKSGAKKVLGFASGGYPASGEMFIARENGIPELVGSIGGRTAVANNDQIVEAISIGVYNAYMDAMSRSGGNKQPTIVQINGREVFRAVQDESTAYSRRTGQPAF